MVKNKILSFALICALLTGCSVNEGEGNVVEFSVTQALAMEKIAINDIDIFLNGDPYELLNKLSLESGEKLSVEDIKENRELLSLMYGESVDVLDITTGISLQDNVYLAEITHRFDDNHGVKFSLRYDVDYNIVGLEFTHIALHDALSENEYFTEQIFELKELDDEEDCDDEDCEEHNDEDVFVACELNAYLTMPNNVNTAPGVPVVIFVSDIYSGNKNGTQADDFEPIKEIAYELSKNNIATIRYDNFIERCFELMDMRNYSLQELMFDDINRIIENVKEDERFSNIYLIGDYMSSTFLPYVETVNKDIEGIIMVNGSIKPYSHTLYERILNINNSEYKLLLDEDYDLESIERDFYEITNSLSEAFDNKELINERAFMHKEYLKYSGENYIDEVDSEIFSINGASSLYLDNENLSYLKDNANKFVMLDNLGDFYLDTNDLKSLNSTELINHLGTNSLKVNMEIVDEIIDIIK